MRRRFRVVGASLVGVLASTVLVNCGGDVGSSSSAKPETLRLAIGGESEEGYDPTLGWGRYGSPLFQSTLLTRNADLSITGDLATERTVSKDGRTWTVDIRSDASFTNGEPVTPNDVAYTFNTSATSGGLVDLTTLEKAVAVDDNTVKFQLKRPQSTFVNRLVTLGIVPQAAHDKGYAQKPIGSGPFEFVSWDRGQQLVVKRNDDYYGKKPAFKKMVFVFTDEDATLAAARSGDVDLAGVPSPLATEKIDGMKLTSVDSLDNRGISMPTVPDEGKISKTGAPIGNDVTSEVAIRRALNLSADRQLLVDGILEGYGSPASGPVDKAPWYNPDTAVREDLAGAKKLLDAAGWTDTDDDGIREKEGKDASFSLIYPADDSVRQGLSIAMVDMAKKAGIEIKTEGVSWEEIDKRMHSDAVMFGWGSHDATEIYDIYSSKRAGIDYFNPNYYKNPAVDRHLDRAMTARTEEAATREWKLAQQPANGEGPGGTADAPWVWLVNLQHTYYVNSCLKLGETQIEPHGHGWPITAGINEWTWGC